MLHLHLLGIAGSFMAGIARLAQECGYTVSGSDNAFYPPFGDKVRQMNIPLYEGYDADCSAREADCYLIGNAISRGNPLLESVLRSGKPFISAPQWLYETVLRRRPVIAVAGTHGKTTTAALLVYLLERAGTAPGFLVGGILPNFGLSARLADTAAPFVIEADEYDSAYFDKRPKFLHYHPRVAVLNNLEFDHADIYPDTAAIIRQFHYLLRCVPGNGQIIARAGDDNLAAAMALGCFSPVAYFSDTPQTNGWHWHYQSGARGGQMTIHHNGEPCGAPFTPPLAGAANRDNILAAVAAAAAVGCAPAQAGEYLAGFKPPLRRLQLITERDGIRIFDDFAHHPTAIQKTLAALAEQRAAKQAGGRLIAVFEPRSNTMKAGVFQDRARWRTALAAADIIIAVGAQEWLANALSDCRGEVHITDTAAAAAQQLNSTAVAGDDIVLMSNGDFGGLAGMLAG